MRISEHKTMQVRLWLENDRELYGCIRRLKPKSYKSFIILMDMDQKKTLEGVKWMDASLNYPLLDEVITEIQAE